MRPLNQLRRRLVLTTLLALGGWGSAWAQDEEAEVAAPAASAFDRAKPFAAMNRMITWAKADTVVAVSREQVGLRYRRGAKAPGKAFDCSGLVQFVMETLQISLPRTANEQAKVGVPVEKDTADLRPGDLLTFGRGKRVTHIGIYVGDGRYVHAANRRKGVIESRLPAQQSRRFARWWKGVRRVLHLTPDSLEAAPAGENAVRRFEPGETPVVEGPAS
ncbi:MAG: C40 family peptidase [Gemmatimonadales bacterium]|nr:C40 family peptidase [Gemmatimonadales bacterium]